ncbi:MAG: hypothetical protein ACW99A_12190 [Candidatus Kariarchaeaceae archaeon]
MRNRITIINFFLILMLLGMSSNRPMSAVEEEEIETAISDGVEYLASRQQPDGSWASDWAYKAAYTAFALIKLQDRATELGYSPFDSEYEYSGNVTAGWQYLFTQVRNMTISTQDHTGGQTGTIDDPDADGNGIGNYFHYLISYSSITVYTTGVTLMALEASDSPNRVNDLGLDLDTDGSPDTFKEIAQDTADWLAYAQGDSGNDEGGWGYDIFNSQMTNGWTDNSVTGYAVLGLAAAEGFGCTVPSWVKTELDYWLTVIQHPASGGSIYNPDWGATMINELKTGNLIFELTFVGIAQDDQRFVDALNYTAVHWNDTNYDPGWGHNRDPANYQAMFCLMKGLEYSQIDYLDLDGDHINETDWYEEFAQVLVDQQEPDGSWRYSGYGTHNGYLLDTVWALLTLEKIFPNLPPVADAGPDQENIEQTSYEGAEVTLDGSGSYDPNDDPLTYNWTWGEDNFALGVTPTITLPLGTTTVNLTVFDGIDYDWDLVNITIVDTTAPELVYYTTENTILWPPNHKYHTINIADYLISVRDICDADIGPEDVVITHVTSDEPEDVNGNGDGKTFDDIVITGDQTVDLRSERQGKGNGRVYTIHFEVVDGENNVATGSIIIEVPHNVGSITFDNGVAYTVFNT